MVKKFTGSGDDQAHVRDPETKSPARSKGLAETMPNGTVWTFEARRKNWGSVEEELKISLYLVHVREIKKIRVSV